MKSVFKYTTLLFVGFITLLAISLAYMRNCKWHPDRTAKYATHNAERGAEVYDFKRKSIIAHSDYATTECEYKIYRRQR